MRKAVLIRCLWTFVAAVAAADVYVTWRCRHSAPEWEANPVAAWALRWFGVAGVALYRAGWLGFAYGVSRVPTRFSRMVPWAWGVGHLFLLVTLVRAYPALTVLAEHDGAFPPPTHSAVVVARSGDLIAARLATIAQPLPGAPTGGAAAAIAGGPRSADADGRGQPARSRRRQVGIAD